MMLSCGRDPYTIAKLIGFIYDEKTMTLLPGVRVDLFYSPDGISTKKLTAYSDLSGSFKFELDINQGATSTAILTSQLPGYNISFDTTTVTGGVTDSIAIFLTPSVIDTTIDTLPPPRVSGPPHSIRFLESTSNVISVKGYGFLENATVTYIIYDDKNIPVDTSKHVVVDFKTSGVSDVTLIPASDSADINGRVKTTVFAGIRSGIVQLYAQIRGTNIIANVVPITIYGGLPNKDHFTVVPETLNIPGAVYAGLVDTISVFAADKYGNYIRPGVSIYFSSKGGHIDGSCITDTFGRCAAVLRSAKPIPDDGMVLVQAFTQGEKSEEVKGETYVLFSSHTAPIQIYPDTFFYITPDMTRDFQYKVCDLKGLPLCPGSKISVSTTNGSLAGHSEVILPDAQNPGWGTTNFGITLYGVEVDSIVGTAPVILTFSVTSRNGNYSRILQGLGVLALPREHDPNDTIGPDNPNRAATIVPVSGTPNPDSIGIKGSGSAYESSQLTFEVRDRLGIPLRHGVRVEFFIITPTGGGEYVYPAFAETDYLGRVTTVLTSGKKPGTVQIVGKVTGTLVESQPIIVTIHSGPPVKERFEIWVDRKTLPFLIPEHNRDTSLVFASLADKYGNPVPKGTSVHFESNCGRVEGSQKTDETGLVTAKWWSIGVTPIWSYPDEIGKCCVIAQTVDENSAWIYDTTCAFWVGCPEDDDVVVLPTYFVISPGQFKSFIYYVSDPNGNVLPESTKITVSTNVGKVVGDTNIVLPDSYDKKWTSFEFSLYDIKYSDSTFAETPHITIKVETPDCPVITKHIFGRLEFPPGGTSGTPGTPGIPGTPADTTTPYLIQLAQPPDPESIFVAGTGGPELTQVKFELKNQYGKLILLPYVVSFRVVGPDDGQPNCLPYPLQPSVISDSGYAIANIRSGHCSGSYQLYARVPLGPGPADTLISQPVIIVVGGGFPDSLHFEITPERFNMGGLRLSGLTQAITAWVGDKYGNPVRTGTVVYFSTTAGIIDESGYTNALGFDTVTLQTTNPRPPIASRPSLYSLGGWSYGISLVSNPLAPNYEGNLIAIDPYYRVDSAYAFITGQTIDQQGDIISQTIPVLWSGTSNTEIHRRVGLFDACYIDATSTLIDPTTGFPASPVSSCTLWVADQYGLPLIGGTNVTIEVCADAEVVGSADFEIPDALVRGQGITYFVIFFRDTDNTAPTTWQPCEITVTVESSENGNIENTYTSFLYVAQ